MRLSPRMSVPPGDGVGLPDRAEAEAGGSVLPLKSATRAIFGREPVIPPLADQEVHIWRVPLDEPFERIGPLAELLDLEESARASRFRFARDRTAFTATRAALRTLAGAYLDQPARTIHFVYGAQGKPSIEGGSLRFNVSHSAGLALLAFTRSIEVGIDVECVRAMDDALELADRFFSRSEIADLQGVPEERRSEAFFCCWTAKEAYIKGIGEGLSMPLDRFAVSIEPLEGHVRLRFEDGRSTAGDWRLERFAPWPGYVAALAVEREGLVIHHRAWRPEAEP